MVQWLRLRDSTAGGTGSITGRGTKILHAMWRGQTNNNNKTKQNALARVVTQLHAKWAVKHADMHGDSPKPRHSQHDMPSMPLQVPFLPP